MIRAKWRYRKDGNAWLVTRGRSFFAKRNRAGTLIVYRERPDSRFVVAICDNLEDARREIERSTDWTKP